MKNCKSTPADSERLSGEKRIPESNLPHRELIGSLMFLATVSRPDIAYIVNYLSRFLNCYSQEHWVAAKRVLRYLQGSKMYGLMFTGRNQNFVVDGYCDSDYAGDLSTRKSTSGYVFMLTGGPVSWLSQR